MSDKHTLRIFDEDLGRLRSEVIRLATQVGEELDKAVQALLTEDHVLADEVIASDRNADALQEIINGHTARTLARQHAVADDLRLILSAARIAMHLERIGDYAKNTAKRSKRLKSPLAAEMSAQLRWMATRIGSMLERVMDAYAREDAATANVAWTDDAELDAAYSRLFETLLTTMHNDRSRIQDCVQLLFIAKGLERAGDHVTDVAEEVYLMVTGTPLQGPRPKVDEAGL